MENMNKRKKKLSDKNDPFLVANLSRRCCAEGRGAVISDKARGAKNMLTTKYILHLGQYVPGVK